MSKHFFLRENAITLVALIITIIVLIILAAVSINTVFKAQFINLATQGTINYAEAQTNEQKQMEHLDAYVQSAIKDIDKNNPAPPIIDKITDIGKYIDYLPANSSYVAEAQYTGTAELEDIYVEANKPQNFSTDANIKWRIFKIDSKYLYLISNNAVSNGGLSNDGQLYLADATGYNNVVKLLNDLCNSCYTNDNYRGLVARSLNISDIEAVTKFDYTNFNNGYATYGQEVRNITGNSPSIWNLFEKYDQFGNKNLQNQWYLGKENGNIELKQSTWINKFSAENSDSEWINNKYYDILLNVNSSFLATRSISITENGAIYDIQCIGNGEVSGTGISFTFNDWRMVKKWNSSTCLYSTKFMYNNC